MTNQALIQSRINHGYSIASSKLGAQFNLYRPISTGPVIDPINLIDIVYAGFDIDPRFSHKAPAVQGEMHSYALLDLTNIQPADYLTDGCRTYFVANIEPLRPALCVLTNRVVSIYRPSSTPTSSAYYGGNVTGLGDPQITEWPASMILGPKGEVNPSGLPADPRAPWYAVMLPAYTDDSGVTTIFKTGDVMVDELNRRFTVSATELTPAGWRITCAYAGS
jgi:hypothetical protein